MNTRNATCVETQISKVLMTRVIRQSIFYSVLELYSQWRKASPTIFCVYRPKKKLISKEMNSDD